MNRKDKKTQRRIIGKDINFLPTQIVECGASDKRSGAGVINLKFRR